MKVEVEELPDTGYPETPVEEEAFFSFEEGAEEFSEKNPGLFAPQLGERSMKEILRSLVSELASQLILNLEKSGDF